MQRWQEVVVASAAAAALLATAGCTPHIGDKCNLNSDCSIQGNLQCDTSLPGGYCTEFNCTPTTCQDNAACVAIGAAVAGCPYDDYSAPSRTALTMCLQSCGQDSDCRTGDGFVCRDPTQPPWNAVIVDNVSQKVCLLQPSYPVVTDASADTGVPPVCQAAWPALDASPFSPVDGEVDALADGPGEAEAPDGGPTEAGSEGGEAGALDAGADGAADVGAAGAPEGG